MKSQFRIICKSCRNVERITDNPQDIFDAACRVCKKQAMNMEEIMEVDVHARTYDVVLICKETNESIKTSFIMSEEIRKKPVENQRENFVSQTAKSLVSILQIQENLAKMLR